jgi:replication factor A1
MSFGEEATEVTAAEEEPVTVAELRPRMNNINITFRVVGKSEPKEVTSRRDGERHRVADATIGDDTGVVIIPLWDDHIESLETGKTYELKNGYTGLFRGFLRLKMGRESELTEAETEIEGVNYEVDMSEERHERPRRDYYRGYGGRSRDYGLRSNYNRRRSGRDNRRRRRRY